MFGLIMAGALGIGAIISGAKHFTQNIDAQNTALRRLKNGENPSQTYYDPFVGSDIDLFSGRKVTRKSLDWSGDEYIVDDKTGKILRNATLNRLNEEADYENRINGKKIITAYNYGKLQRMWGEKAFNKVPGFTIGNHPRDITVIHLYCKTKKKCFKIYDYQYKELREALNKYGKEIYGYDKMDCRCYFILDFYNGEIIDYNYEYDFDKPCGYKGKERIEISNDEMHQLIRILNNDIKEGKLKRRLSGWEVLFK